MIQRNSGASSKCPVDELMKLPRGVIALAERLPGVVYHKDYRSDSARAGFINQFLKPLPTDAPTTTAILFQGAGPEIGTMVAEVKVMLWADWEGGAECARLSIGPGDSRDWLRIVGAGINFWSPFILAIAKVKPGTQIGLMGEASQNFRDYKGELFVRVVEANHA